LGVWRGGFEGRGLYRGEWLYILALFLSIYLPVKRWMDG
jgi:hypothetical protein